MKKAGATTGVAAAARRKARRSMSRATRSSTAVPKTFEAAQSDGQRWRWCLEQAVEFNPGLKNEVRLSLADFLHDQFGVQTMAAAGWRFGREGTDDSQEEEAGRLRPAVAGRE